MPLINLPGLEQYAYHLVDGQDGVTLILRDGSNACVGRIHPARPDASDNSWTAELGQLKVMTPFPSREEALETVCAYADTNPQLAI